MLKTLLCKLNLGHHWVAEADQEGKFRRRCRNCGKYARHGVGRSRDSAADDHPGHSDIPEPPSHF
ncbi:MAG: hypothetical protein JWQ75_257 [Pseudarthrobacter sp.]|nr:hypothetical protein [Pseudarthrobacter sp.]